MRVRGLRLVAFASLLLGIALFTSYMVIRISRPEEGFRQVETTAGSDQLFSLALLAIAAMGTLIAVRRPDHRVGWLFCLVGSIGLVMVTASEYAIRSAFGEFTLPGGYFAAWLSSWIWAPFLLAVVVTLLVYPNGRLPSRRWRFVPWVPALAWFLTLVAAALSWGVDLRALTSSNGLTSASEVPPAARFLASLALPLFPISIVLPAVSQVVRFRRSLGEERQQLKWLAFAASLLILGPILDVASALVPGSEFVSNIGFAILGPLGLLGIPIASAIAILRYRLFDIDVVINKTFVYFALAAFITLIYVGVVVGVGSVVGAGDEPNLGLSLAATALVAVAFQPVRERVQRLANRMVYGQRLSPYEAVTSFSRRMAESLPFDEMLPSIGQAAASAVGGSRARVKLLFPLGGSEQIFWPAEPAQHDQTQNSFDATVEVVHQGERVGEISVAKKKGEALSPQEHKLLSDLASQAGLAFSNLRLTEELKAKLVELQESRRRIVSAQDEERRRMERDIHDGAQQQLVSMSVKLGLAKSLLDKDLQKASSMLDELKGEASEAVDTLRDLARGLVPPLLSERGIGAAIASHIQKANIAAQVEDRLDGARFEAEVESSVYFVIREALQNASKHATGANIAISLKSENGDLVFEVEDSGQGFHTSKAKVGSGIENMSDRLEALGGNLDVHSELGSGTRVTGSIPNVLVIP